MNAARLTNYVVAHSEYSSPLGRRSVLSGIVAEGGMPLEAKGGSSQDESAAVPTPAELVEQQ
jgi:hypothetical protein